MSNPKAEKQADAIYNDIIKFLDNQSWKYTRNDQNRYLSACVMSDDLPIQVYISVLSQMDKIIVVSFLPFEVPPTMVEDVALALAHVNMRLPYGYFEFDHMAGKIIFSSSTLYKNSLLSHSVYNYIIGSACDIIDTYNDKILALVEEKMSLETFIEQIARM